MPRTFSRGEKFTGAKILQIIDENMSFDERVVVFDEFRRRFTPEPPLEEQEIEDLLDILRRISDFIEDFAIPGLGGLLRSALRDSFAKIREFLLRL